MLETIVNHPVYHESILIAEGTPAVAGENGQTGISF
ncbi:MAG: hypothetical protein ACOX4M_08805 [Acetivibrionales bacterium]